MNNIICPICKSQITLYKGLYKCEKNAGEQIVVELTSNAGKEFRCNGELEDRGRYHGIKFIFEDFKLHQLPFSENNELKNDNDPEQIIVEADDEHNFEKFP